MTAPRARPAREPLPRLPFAEQCVICGPANPIGLRLEFFEQDERVVSEFVVEPRFQGFDGILQGGVLQAVLDDAMVRAVWRAHGLNVTVRMEIELTRAIRVGQRVRIEAAAGERRGRLVSATARALLDDGAVAAESRGRFLLVTAEKLRELGGG